MCKEDLLKAYSETAYIIPELNITIRIGERNLQLDRVLNKYNSNSWAFVSAENPRSQELTSEENRRRTVKLKSLIEDWEFIYFEGYGKGTGEWEPEQSFLILDISQDEAIEKTGLPFEQNAIVTGNKDLAPELCIIEDIFNQFK